MPQGGGTAIGNVLEAIGTGKPDIRFTTIDPARQGRLNSIWSQYDVSSDPTKNADYLSAYAAATPAARDISQGNLGFLNRTVTQPFDPTADYSTILNLNKDALGSFLMNPALNELTRQRKATQARLGYGGQGQGVYDSILQGRILQQLASGAVPNLLGYTNQAYATAGGLRNQDILNRLGIIGSGEQYRQLDTPALRYLEPTRLARSDIEANLRNLTGISTAEDQNRAYYRNRSGLERAGAGLNAFQSGLVNEINDALSIYSSLYSGGMMGGAGGGGGALGGIMGGSSGSGGGGGTGNQTALLQQLLRMYGGGGASYSPYTTPDNYSPF